MHYIKIVLRSIFLLNLFLLPVGIWFSILSDVRVINDYSIGSWTFNFYVTLLLVNLASFYCLYATDKKRFNLVKIKWKNSNFVLIPIAYGLFLAWFTFSGLPKFLHNFTSSEGTIELTITSKFDYEYRGRCTPRVKVEEVTVFMKSYICVSKPLFDTLNIGSKVMGYGHISNYGIEILEVR